MLWHEAIATDTLAWKKIRPGLTEGPHKFRLWLLTIPHVKNVSGKDGAERMGYFGPRVLVNAEDRALTQAAEQKWALLRQKWVAKKKKKMKKAKNVAKKTQKAQKAKEVGRQADSRQKS